MNPPCVPAGGPAVKDWNETLTGGPRAAMRSLRGEVAELAEGAPLLREYTGKTGIAGSNPALSASPYSTRLPSLLAPA